MELEGNWTNGVLNGKCRIKWKSGNIFDGQLINNYMDGDGYMVWFDKNEKYSGMWKNNLQKEMDMENFIIVMVIYMKANGKKIKKKALVYFITKIELNILGVLKKTI